MMQKEAEFREILFKKEKKTSVIRSGFNFKISTHEQSPIIQNGS